MISRRLGIAAVFALGFCVFLVVRKVHFIFPIKGSKQHSTPIMLLTGHRNSSTLMSISLPSGRVFKRGKYGVLSNVYDGYVIQGAFRANLYTTPSRTNAKSLNYCLQQWIVDLNKGYVKNTLPLEQYPANSVTCSPNGRYSAFWTRSNNMREIYNVDWQTKQIRRVAVLNENIRDYLWLSCSDKDDVYVNELTPATSPASVTSYHSDGNTNRLSGFNQIVTNKAGSFGITWTVKDGLVVLYIRNIQNPSAAVRHYTFDCVTGFEENVSFSSKPSFRVNSALSSDDDKWWGIKITQTGEGSPVFVVWHNKDKQPYYVLHSSYLKGFSIVALQPTE